MEWENSLDSPGAERWLLDLSLRRFRERASARTGEQLEGLINRAA